jgi:hypothetical protein
MNKWEYCYVSLLGKDQYLVCTTKGTQRMRVDQCSGAKDPRDCVIAHLGLWGWEAFTHDNTRQSLWFKRLKQS